MHLLFNILLFGIFCISLSPTQNYLDFPPYRLLYIIRKHWYTSTKHMQKNYAYTHEKMHSSIWYWSGVLVFRR